jgi:hypothetical protein
MAVDKIARMQNARNTSDLAQIASQLNTATTLTHTQTESVKSLPTGTLDGVVDNFETRGLSLVNLVAGSDIAAAGTVSFQSVVGAKYYDSLNETVLTGTGASMTATNASGATADMMIIPMTALGIADYTEAQMLDLVRGGYFDGLKGVENAEVTTVGKNLFDKTKVSPVANQYYETDILLKRNTNYAAKWTGVRGENYRIDGLDSNSVLINYVSTQGTFNSGGNSKVRVYLNINCNVANITLEKLSQFQLEEGTTATEYEPYKSSHLTITPTLRSLPNGVHDRVYEADGQVWLEKRVAEKVLGAGDIVNENTVAFTNVDFFLTSGTSGIFELSPDGNNAIVEGFSYLAGDVDDSTAHYTYRLEGTSGVLFRVPKGTYTSLAAAQAALAGTVIHYQLATPQLINLTAEGLTEGELQAFANGTVYLDADAFHVPSASFDVPTNTGAVIQSLVESANAQAKAIESKADKVNGEWIAPTFLNSWVNFDAHRLVEYSKNSFNDVRVRGVMKSGANGVPAFNLPAGFRLLLSGSADGLIYFTHTNTGLGYIELKPNGNVVPQSGGNDYVFFDFTFRAEA